MFHRPPAVDPSFERESRMNSYNLPEDDDYDDNSSSTVATSNEVAELVKENDVSVNEFAKLVSSLEKLQIDSVKLPDELAKEFESFIKFLKLPKFNRPLNLDDISQLYQQFYQDFHNKNVNYWNNHYGIHEQKETELLTKEEILQRNENVNKAKNHIYLSDLLIEKLVCNKYYKKIIKSDKKLVKDEMNNLINKKLNLKLTKLNDMKMTLKNLDLDLDLLDEQQQKLIDELAPIYKEMFEIRCPTLKLLKFKRVHEVINQFLKKLNIKINGDYYLPILIYSMIKIRELSEKNLILELNFIKNFKNNVVYEKKDSNESGELLYILTNFDACLIYLLNVTITDLKLEPNDDGDSNANDKGEADEILTKSISIDESSLTYCEDYQMVKKNSKNNSALDYYSLRLQEYAYNNADHGIRTIGSAFDSSVKSIFGRFLPSSSSSTEIDKETLSQIEENFNNKLDEEEVISPISTTSTLNTSNSSSSNNPISTSPQQQQHQQMQHQESNSNDPKNTSLKSFASSMNGVIKQFRPISNSNSSTSLHTTLESSNLGTSSTSVPAATTAITTTTVAESVRSRGASFIGDVFNPPARSSSSSIITTIEHAFEGRRSRGNSLLSGLSGNGNINNGGNGNNINQQTLITDLKKEYKDKKFENMSVADLKKMYDNYKKIMYSTNNTNVVATGNANTN